MGKSMTLTLTNDHLCSHTDGGKSDYVFHTSPGIVLPDNVELKSDSKALEGGTDEINIDRK
jgi:hypothetical protein